MKTRAMSFFGSMVLLGLMIGVATPPPAYGWDTINKLYRCTRQARSTVCYEGWTTVYRYPELNNDGGELWASDEIGVRTDAVYGGGLMFTAPPGADANLDTWARWNYNYSNASAGYEGFIHPCAPGGPWGWRHHTTHYVEWDPASGYGYLPTDFRDKQTHLPLPVTTCEDGGGLD
jgi:hypothetical protein